jgi:CheY-like chemotaxis protein
MHILIVDDYPDSADSLAELLALYGYTTRTAYDVNTALALARAFKPDLVLCDLIRKVEDGLAFYTQYRDEVGLSSTRLVALTALGGRQNQERLQAAGFDGCLQKPVDYQELLQVITRVAEPALHA